MVNVLKANGSVEPFSEEKLRDSIGRAGIPTSVQEQVVSQVKAKVYENIPTSEVYEHVTKSLESEPHLTKFRYFLKRALMELGPTGYPFEDLVAEILQSKSYTTQVRSTLMGKCVNHEIDVIAQKETEKLLVEAKFHNAPGIHTDLHVSLYTNARFEDLREKHAFTKAWLFTNTKITPDALSYALCVGMQVTGWNYPQNEGLRDLIGKERLYPITILASLSQSEKQTLLENHIVLVNQVLKNEQMLDVLGIPPDKKTKIAEEAKLILNE